MRIKRLKQPKYLVGGIVGGLYFYWYFFRMLFGTPGRGQAVTLLASPENLALYESLGALILLTILLLAWIIPHQRAALTFTEAEVAFLFPAPISRRGLIHFKLLRSQTAILFTTLLLTLVTNRFGGQGVDSRGGLVADLFHFEPAFAGFLVRADNAAGPRHHQLAAASGDPGPGACLMAGVVVVWARQAMPRFDLSRFENLEAVKDYAQQVLTAGPLPYLLYPLRLVVRPYLAPNALAFLLRAGTGPAAAVAALLVGRALERRVRRGFRRGLSRSWRRRSPRCARATGRRRSRQPKRKRPPFKLRPSRPAGGRTALEEPDQRGPGLHVARVAEPGRVCGLALRSGSDRPRAARGLRSALGMIAAMLMCLVAAHRAAVPAPGFPAGPAAGGHPQDLPVARLAACARRTARAGGGPDRHPVVPADSGGGAVLATGGRQTGLVGAGWAWVSARR